MIAVDLSQPGNMMPRTRKLSLDHHSNSVLIDRNGGARQWHRLSRLTEDSDTDDVTSCQNETSVPENESSDTNAWDHTVLTQIQSLITNVRMTDTLMDYISKEINNGSANSTTSGQRTRRKSCFALNSEQSGARRRVSVSSKAASLPRTGLSQAMTPSTGRRNSVAHAGGGFGGRRMSVTAEQGTRSRRNSVQHHDIRMGNGGRRNSVAHTYNVMTRRVSLAHAYQNPTFDTQRRASCAHDNTSLNPTAGPSMQRRKSSIKPPCFPVSKIANVQQRLNKMYRRRKRNERAQVDMKDVRRAFKDIRRATKGDVTSSDACTDTDVDDLAFTSESREMCDPQMETATDEAGVNMDTAMETSSTADTEEPEHTDDVTPRRKLSMQVRAWELSRRLRQRRKDKRKGFTESDLI